MDGAVTDGAYGRELLQLVLRLPSGVDPVFDRYRASAMLDHGDWDGLRGLESEPVETHGVREIVTAPLDHVAIPVGIALHQRRLFEAYEYEMRREMRLLKKWAMKISGVFTEELWRRSDIAIGRHMRFRRLHDTVMLAIGESHAGRLEVAHALAQEGERLGDTGEPLRAMAHDLAELTRLAMGDSVDFELATIPRVVQPTGPSPLGTWELLSYLMPLLPLRSDATLTWAAQVTGYIAARLASPRGELQAASWRVAGDLWSGVPGNKTELAGLAAKSRKATPGLKGLPIFLSGYSGRRYEAFEDAERLARRAGNVWLQISALTWMTALDPRASPARHLRMLLDVTGWRRPALVPTEIAADAALGLTAMGERSESILELAITANRPNVTSEVATRYIDDPNTPDKVRRAAVDALGQINTTHAKETLAKLAQRRDDVGKTAAAVRERPSGLSEREVEVLALAAEGLTNKRIADKLFLSPHTVARHIANARAKLGAANRTAAAALVRRPTR